MKADMTKSELIRLITKKVQKAKPPIRRLFLNGLERQKKSRLVTILRRARVDRDGWGISL